MNIKKSAIFMLMISFSALIHANRLFLQNNYGAEIICTVNRVINHPLMPNNGEPTPIANGMRVLLGLVPFDPNLRNSWVTGLEIKTSRYIPTSPSPLQNYVEKLTQELQACCTMKLNFPICKENICNKDAVIYINPSNINEPWNIKPLWEAAAMGQRKIGEFEMEKW